MIKTEIISIWQRNDVMALASFGKVFGGFLVAVGLALLILSSNQTLALWILIPGSLILLAGIAMPRSLGVIYRIWMSLAAVLGALMSSLLLSLVFYLILTPIAIVRRMSGWDMEHEPDSPGSYWIGRKGGDYQPEHTEKQS